MVRRLGVRLKPDTTYESVVSAEYVVSAFRRTVRSAQFYRGGGAGAGGGGGWIGAAGGSGASAGGAVPGCGCG